MSLSLCRNDWSVHAFWRPQPEADVQTPGVVFAQGRSHRFSARGLAPTPLPGVGGAPYYAQPSQWRAVRTLFDGRHPGCVEGRRADHDVGLSKLLNATPESRLACELDGRISAVEFSGRTWLYARANPALSGQRFVQVTSSADLHKWAPFSSASTATAWKTETSTSLRCSAIRLLPHTRLCRWSGLPRSCTEVRAASGSPPPSTPCDGRRRYRCCAAAPTRATDPFHPGHRATHQPAAGMLQRGDRVLIFVHEFVSGIIQHTSKATDRGPHGCAALQCPSIYLPRGLATLFAA